VPHRRLRRLADSNVCPVISPKYNTAFPFAVVLLALAGNENTRTDHFLDFRPTQGNNERTDRRKSVARQRPRVRPRTRRNERGVSGSGRRGCGVDARKGSSSTNRVAVELRMRPEEDNATQVCRVSPPLERYSNLFFSTNLPPSNPPHNQSIQFTFFLFWLMIATEASSPPNHQPRPLRRVSLQKKKTSEISETCSPIAFRFFNVPPEHHRKARTSPVSPTLSSPLQIHPHAKHLPLFYLILKHQLTVKCMKKQRFG